MATITGYAMQMISEISANLTNFSVKEAIIFDIAIILIVSAILAFIARIFRQPLIPAYIITGLIIGPLVLGLVKNTEIIYAFSEIGIAFLLFTAGLEISFKKIKGANLNKIILVGIFQIFIITLVGILLSKSLNLTTMQAVYLGIIMAFSSTMVDVKLLSDKRELVTMHGRLILGILLLQDFAAIIAIIVFTAGGFAIVPIIMSIVKLFIILGIAIFLQRFILNPLFKFAARSTELLLLSSLAVLFVFIILTYISNLSIVIGAFIAGVSLANSPFKLELESRISPLRDFFAILFFVALGMQIILKGMRIDLFLFLLLITFLVKPFVTLILLRIEGYRPLTSFMTSISLAQLSEFSLIIGMLGVSLNVLNTQIFSTIILATITTMSITPYLINYKREINRFVKKPLRVFKFLPVKENLSYIDKEEKKILLVGSHRMGSIILKDLMKRRKKEVLVIDHNPEIINALINKKISCIYGDLGSPELLDSINFEKLKLVISTVPNADDNLRLLKKIKEKNEKITIILTAQTIDDALEFYKKGADYVILPKVIAGTELTKIIHSTKYNLDKERQEHIKKLKEIHNILY